MNGPAAADLLVRARAALLDALDALAEQRNAMVVIGAQAIYLHTGGTTLALAETTKDSDLTVEPRALDAEPLAEQAMRAAGFELDTVARQHKIAEREHEPHRLEAKDAASVAFLAQDLLAAIRSPGGDPAGTAQHE